MVCSWYVDILYNRINWWVAHCAVLKMSNCTVPAIFLNIFRGFIENFIYYPQACTHCKLRCIFCISLKFREKKTHNSHLAQGGGVSKYLIPKYSPPNMTKVRVKFENLNKLNQMCEQIVSSANRWKHRWKGGGEGEEG